MLTALIQLSLLVNLSAQAPKCPDGQAFNPETKKCEVHKGGTSRDR